MALRKQINKDASDIPSGSQLMVENTQEDKPLGDKDDSDELSSSLLVPLSRGKRRGERENKPKSKEMTEEEMVDLALRLSEQEASVTALRLQKEEEAVMKAIQESMVCQTQQCPPSQSQSLLADPEASFRLCSRRKLLYSNGKPASAAIDQGASGSPETDLNRANGTGDESNKRNKKRKRKEGSPLLEMPDLSQTQKIYSQASPCSSESLDLPLDSPQSSDSTQIDNCQLHKSPVFPSTDCIAMVHVPRLSQNLLETCRTSGFVLCSQDSWTSPRKSPPKSPTIPKRSSNFPLSKSPVFSENDQGDDKETELSPECFKSPVFGRNTQHERSPSACRPGVSICNPGLMSSSQESLFSSERSTSCWPTSPIFPKSSSLPKNSPPRQGSAICKSPVFSDTDGGQTEQSHRRCTSPVFGRTVQRQKINLDVQKLSASPSATELRGSGSEGNSTTSRAPSLRQGGKADHNADSRFNKMSLSDDAEELREISKDGTSAETELTSDMTLLWSDEDDDDTPVGSPSPVFPVEGPVRQAESQAASFNHVTAASPGTSGSNCRVSSSPAEPAGGQTVHYYWGVPFCPQGLDPDSYTQVIVAQMEVYEKSLKQAQRRLLRKAEWGEAVLPQPEKSPSPESPSPESPQHHVPRRRDLRLRGKKLCEAAGITMTEEKEEEQERESEEEEKKDEGGGEDGQVDTDCEVCPETQLSDNDDDRTQDLMMDTDAGAELQPESPELPEFEMILQDDSPAGEETQEEQMELEVDAPVERKSKENIPVSGSDSGRHNVLKEEIEEDQGDPDVEEIKDRGLQRSASPELEPATVAPSPETNIDCPICQGSFSVMDIEMHAAYCDGEVAVVDERRPKPDCFPVSLKPRRLRTRKAEGTAEETKDPSNTGKNQEKCYICQKVVPVRGYSRHTELCIQRQASKTAAKGNLLSALEQTEAGPSGSKLQPGDIIDLRDDDDDDDEEVEADSSVSALRISNSSIRSFTPISEATDCLIDFKKQQRVKKLSQRRR